MDPVCLSGLLLLIGFSWVSEMKNAHASSKSAPRQWMPPRPVQTVRQSNHHHGGGVQSAKFRGWSITQTLESWTVKTVPIHVQFHHIFTRNALRKMELIVGPTKILTPRESEQPSSIIFGGYFLGRRFCPPTLTMQEREEPFIIRHFQYAQQPSAFSGPRRAQQEHTWHLPAQLCKKTGPRSQKQAWIKSVRLEMI